MDKKIVVIGEPPIPSIEILYMLEAMSTHPLTIVDPPPKVLQLTCREREWDIPLINVDPGMIRDEAKHKATCLKNRRARRKKKRNRRK